MYDDDDIGNYDGNFKDGEEDNEEDLNMDSVLPGVDDLPLFANAEARKIHLDNKEKADKLENVQVSINDMRERVKVMQEHFKNVQQEVEHTNALAESKRAETKTEQHLKQLMSRQLGRCKSDSRSLSENIEKAQDQLNQLQNQIYKANEKLDEFKLQMNWNQEELEQWAVAASQKEEDNIVMQKYTRADEIKIKELNLHIEQLTKELLQKKQQLENEVTDTQAKQMELDRIADEFRQVHKERQALVTQWQETIEVMKQRDVEINEIGERYAVAKAERAKMEEKVSVQRKRLQYQIHENNEAEAKSESLSRMVSKRREEMVSGSAALVEYRNELESLKNELTSAAEGLVTKRAANAHKAKEIEERRVQVERERQRYQLVKARLEESVAAAQKTEQTAKEAEDELSKCEKEFAAQHAKLKSLKDALLRETQAVHDLKREEAALKSEISGTKSATRNLEAKLAQLDKEAARQQELLYNAEFQIQQIERKVARGMGERSDEEKKILRAQIEAAEKALEQIKEKKKMLMQQARKLMNELVAGRMHKEELSIRKSDLTERIGELELENRMIEEEIKRDTKQKEESTVQNDVLRLEVRRLRSLLSSKADAVYSLENRKQQLQLSMLERKQEISVHKDILRAELRTLADEKHNLTLDLRNRELAVDKLKARYDTALQSRGEQEGHSQSYYIIQAAQKKEELRRRGDELDTEIRKSERELRALQTTLDHLNARNMAFRASFQKIDLKGDDAEVLLQLEERTKLAKESLFRKKKELQRLVTDYEEDGRRLEQLRHQTDRVTAQQEHLQNAKAQVEDEILTQQAQLDELTQRSEKAVQTHRTKLAESMGVAPDALSGGTLEEKAVRAEVMKDVVQVITTYFEVM